MTVKVARDEAKAAKVRRDSACAAARINPTAENTRVCQIAVPSIKLLPYEEQSQAKAKIKTAEKAHLWVMKLDRNFYRTLVHEREHKSFVDRMDAKFSNWREIRRNAGSLYRQLLEQEASLESYYSALCEQNRTGRGSCYYPQHYNAFSEWIKECEAHKIRQWTTSPLEKEIPTAKVFPRIEEEVNKVGACKYTYNFTPTNNQLNMKPCVFDFNLFL